MKKLTKIFLSLFASALFLTSCSSDDNSNSESLGAYDNGTFVLNEGNTTTSTSSITFISNSGAVEQDVYKNVNPSGVALGTYLQSMFFDDTRAYIISGSANKITVVDRYTFKFIATIATDFANPRYGAVANGKAFVTVKTITENERYHIFAVLKMCNGKISGKDGAAKLLAVPATTLNSKIKRLGLAKKHLV